MLTRVLPRRRTFAKAMFVRANACCQYSGPYCRINACSEKLIGTLSKIDPALTVHSRGGNHEPPRTLALITGHSLQRPLLEPIPLMF